MGPAGLQRRTAARKVLGVVINDWQLSGIFTGGSGNRYDLSYSYNNGGEREPDRLARLRRAQIVYVGDPGSGCSERPVRAVQHRGGGRARPTAASAWNRAATSWSAARTRRSTSRSRATSALAARVSCSSGWTRSTRSTSSVINARNTDPVPQPDRPDGPQLAVPRGRFAGSDPADAAERWLRRGDRRPADAEPAGARSGSSSDSEAALRRPGRAGAWPRPLNRFDTSGAGASPTRRILLPAVARNSVSCSPTSSCNPSLKQGLVVSHCAIHRVLMRATSLAIRV